VNPEAAIPAAVIAFILWLAQFFMGNRPIVMPPEVGKAMKALEVNANKLGDAADAITSWHLIAALVVGLLFGLAIARRKS
jgi:hypothetical protein